MITKTRTWLLSTEIGRITAALLIGVLGVGFLSAAADRPDPITKIETTTKAIAFSETVQEDENLSVGERRIGTSGVNGSKQVTYEVDYRGAEEVSRTIKDEEIVTQPVAQVLAKGVRSTAKETKTESIPFAATTVNDATLEKGKTILKTAGVNGEKSVTYEIVKIRGSEVSRAAMSERVTKPPVNQVTAVGVKVQASAVKPATPRATASGRCSPNYSGCVPIASDVDCGGGSGNGPAYFYGTARVIGVDIYDLDRDNDGIACE